MNGGIAQLSGLERLTRGSIVVDTPDDIPGLIGWWKTESLVSPSNGVEISDWPDASGNARTATPVNASNHPTYRTNVVNSRPACEYNADVLDFGSTSFGTSHTLMFAFRTIGSFSGDGYVLLGNQLGVYGLYIDGSNVYYSTHIGGFVTVAHGGYAAATTYIYEIVRNDTTVKFYKNGSQIGTTQTLASNTSLTLQYLGGFNNVGVFQYGPDSMYCAETIAWDTGLNDTDRVAMESYLNTRFAAY